MNPKFHSWNALIFWRLPQLYLSSYISLSSFKQGNIVQSKWRQDNFVVWLIQFRDMVSSSKQLHVTVHKVKKRVAVWYLVIVEHFKLFCWSWENISYWNPWNLKGAIPCTCIWGLSPEVISNQMFIGWLWWIMNALFSLNCALLLHHIELLGLGHLLHSIWYKCILPLLWNL